jgi:hypothetical protein
MPSSAPWPRPRQAWYAVTIFALALMVNFLDRGILNLLVEPIKRDLHLSDLQISLIMGFAFACRLRAWPTVAAGARSSAPESRSSA